MDDRSRPLANSSPSGRKPSHLSWESFAERRIREAIEAGEFDNVTGLGKPIPDIDQPLDENWWVKRKLRDENLSVVPPTIAARREKEKVRTQILSISSEAEVRRRLTALNELILAAIYSTSIGPSDGVQLVDIDVEVSRWQQQRSQRRT